MKTHTPTRPILRYYGGKWRIAPQIVALFPPHAVYVEPFGGGASVLLRKQRAISEVYNDLDREVTNVFRMIRDRSAELQAACALTPYSREEYEASYEETDDTIEAARRFIFRSAAGIGTNSAWRPAGFRTSLCDVKNSPAISWAGYPVHVPAVAERLRGVIIENRDAVAVMAQYDAPHTLHYVDPPYLKATRNSPSKGYRHEFKEPGEHETLLKFLTTLVGRVVLSGYDDCSYDEWLIDWHKVKLSGARDQQNAARAEVLWMNFKPEQFLL